MLTKELLVSRKDDLQNLAAGISDADRDLLVEWLKEKDDTLRYTAFLLLQILSAKDDRVYRHWETFSAMIDEENSYQRSLGLMLIAENIRWDSRNLFENICGSYLERCDDEKFITSRQCIQGLQKIISQTSRYNHRIVDTLFAIDLDGKKETQQGLLLLDIAEVLEKIYKGQKEEESLHTRIESYLRGKYDSGNDKIKKRIKKILG